MLSHDFKDMPGHLTDVGIDSSASVMLLRCTWCMKTPSKAREDGCPIHELEDKGQMLLSLYNPDGVEYFKNRLCLTCEREIMGHWLRRGSAQYFCYENQNTVSEGIDKCIYDVSNIAIPVEATEPTSVSGGICPNL